ncbi:hypothetical protein Bca52824_065432 [Brassica carinata]|uniref:RING-type domain-containing protein n=1 Tax=Brassica carinata TaxID=52824 RepID=A0A8X7QIR0_BRACI|nr:hypothetical protein Bca52824_065432 [Brassica carinata]
MKIKRPRTQQTEIVISVALKTASHGHLLHDTVGDMESMLEYHEIDFDSAMEIIKQTSDFVARTIPTLGDPTVTDIDIIVKIPNHSLDAVRRIDLDVYFIELCENRREPTPSEKDDICPISCEEFGTEREINSLNCKHSYHHHCILDWITKTLTCPYCRANLA